MIALHITDVKEFMNLTLITETFDAYMLEEATVLREYTFSLEGKLTEDYYSEDEKAALGIAPSQRFLPYGRFRSLIFDQIKGKRTPKMIKLILALDPEEACKRIPDLASHFPENAISEFVLQLVFDSNGLILRSGVSYRTFVPDHSMERSWETYLKEFLKNHQICYEEL